MISEVTSRHLSTKNFASFQWYYLFNNHTFIILNSLLFLPNFVSFFQALSFVLCAKYALEICLKASKNNHAVNCFGIVSVRLILPQFLNSSS